MKVYPVFVILIMKNIFLIGLPSSGKSFLGHKLAESLGYRFIDLDKCIEADQGMSVSGIFAEKGEEHFRKVESALLQAIAPDIRLLVATGGGAPCFFDNMDYIRRNGLSLFLDVPPSILAERIRRYNVNDRPLLAQARSLEEELEKKYRERLPFYLQADLTISGETDPERVLKLIRPLL